MRILHKTIISAMSMFTAASLAFPTLASASPIAGFANYTVQRGDSFWKIAHEYDISVQSLLRVNREVPIFNMQIGTDLMIPLGKAESKVNSTPSNASQSTPHHVNSYSSSKPNPLANSANYEAQKTTNTKNFASSTDSQNLYWMARTINAEACGEPMAAKVAVGDVVMHRLEATNQYKTVHDVVFAVENGHYQFTCVANGYIYSNPTSSSIAAAREVLNQHIDLVPGASVFFNPAMTPSSSWVWNQPRITEIGNFVFSR